MAGNTSLVNNSLMQLNGNMAGEGMGADNFFLNESNYELGKLEMSQINVGKMMIDSSKLEESKIDNSKILDASKLNESKLNESKLNESNLCQSKLDESKVLESIMLSNSVMNTSKVNTPMDTSKVEMVSKDISFESGRFGGAQPISLMSSCDPNVLVPEQIIKPVEGVVQELPDEESLSIDRSQSLAQSSVKAASD